MQGSRLGDRDPCYNTGNTTNNYQGQKRSPKQVSQFLSSLTFSLGSVDSGRRFSLNGLPGLLLRSVSFVLLLLTTSPRSRFFTALFFRVWARIDRGDLGVIFRFPRRLLAAPEREAFFGVGDIISDLFERERPFR